MDTGISTGTTQQEEPPQPTLKVDPSQNANSPQSSPFIPDEDEVVVKLDDFHSFLQYFQKRIRLHPSSIIFESKQSGLELFTKADWSKFEEIRRKYKHNRKILTDRTHILVKEIPSKMHNRCSSTLQSILSEAICQQILPLDGRKEFEKIVPCGDGELGLGRFSGEPDGGLAWWGEIVPFVILETGYSDSGGKTRNRAQHWIVRGGGQVEVKNKRLNAADIHVYRWSTSHPTPLVPRNSVHGRCVAVTQIDLINHPTKVLQIPTDTVTTSNAAPPANPALPANMDVDLSPLHRLIVNLVQLGAA